MALIASSAFGVGEDRLDLLIDSLFMDWHTLHETIVSIVGRYRRPRAVAALYHVATWVPEYLEFDDSRSLARNAIGALGEMPGPEADDALRRLCDSDDTAVREEAIRALRGRPAADPH